MSDIPPNMVVNWKQAGTLNLKQPIFILFYLLYKCTTNDLYNVAGFSNMLNIWSPVK